MSELTPEQTRDFLERWRAVAARECDELRTASIELKFRQLDALFGSRLLLAPPCRDPREREELCERWLRIRRALSA